MTQVRRLDTDELTSRVQAMYTQVADEPDQDFHFETGRALALRLGYPVAQLDAIPAGALESFAGVGYFLDLAAIGAGDTVLDLGSGSGTDTFLAAAQTGTTGRVIGVDMTPAQLDKARRLASQAGFGHVEFRPLICFAQNTYLRPTTIRLFMLAPDDMPAVSIAT